MPVAHVLAVEEEAEAFADLFEAASAAGMRVGWLRLSAVPPPEALERAVARGAFRAAAVDGGRSVSLKATRGAPVLRDVLREHFKGCRLVLVQGGTGLPVLRSIAGAWAVVSEAGGHQRELDTAGLVAALRRPRLELPVTASLGGGIVE